jgi:hypothetical protein
MRQTPTLDIQPERDPLATIAVSAAPVVLEGRYRLLMRTLWQLRHSRRTRWGVGLGSAAVMLLLAFLAVRHFATTSWPLSQGEPGLLVAAGLLLLLAQALKAPPSVPARFQDERRSSPPAVGYCAAGGGSGRVRLTSLRRERRPEQLEANRAFRRLGLEVRRPQRPRNRRCVSTSDKG